MRTFLSITLVLSVVLSCSRESIPPEPLTHHVIHASAGEESATVKTVVNPENDTKVLWSPREKVGVFTGTILGKPYLFTGTNAASQAQAAFEGDGPGDLGTYIMVYPYDVTSSWTYPDVTATLPSVQPGKAGSFADGMALMAGTSSTMSVVCRHVCSGIRFMVTGSDILSVSLKGNNHEKIAGRFPFHFDAGVPVANSGTEEEVVLSPAGGGCFSPGQWYYITCLPTVFSKGITLTAVSATRGVGTYAINTSLTFTRALFKNKANLDGSMSWTPVSPSVSNTYYGPANSFCLEPGQSTDIDVSPKFLIPGWKRSGESIGGTAANAYEVLWNNGTVTASLDGSTLTVNAGANTGTALVAIKNGSTILWSFLVWVTESAPAKTTLPSGAVLQEKLGGSSNLKFQWGRKDPLQAGATNVSNQGDDGLAYSLAHPTVLIEGGASTYDWYTGNIDNTDNKLWGGVGGTKTVWDPCPQGWRIPSEADFAGLTPDEHRDFGFNDGSYYSSTTLTGNFVSSLLVTYYPSSSDYTYELKGDHRSNTFFIRCVKE